MSERMDGDRIVVQGYSAGSHFPRVQAATQFCFEANGMSPEGAFHIDGSVYGRDVRLRGPGTVCGPVLGRGDITLQNHTDQPQRLLGGLHSSGNIACIGRGAALPDSLVASVAKANYAIRGDVIGEHVSLENAVVFGNVRGRNVKLIQCIILGQVLAKESAKVCASTVLAYDAPAVRFEGPCCMLFPSGVSATPPEFVGFLDGAQQVWESDIRFYPAMRLGEHAAMTHRPWEQQTDVMLSARLHAPDWVRVETQQKQVIMRDGKRVEKHTPATRFVLSIAGRALNFGALTPHLEHLTWMLKTALEFEHYHPNDQQEIRKRWADRCRPDERQTLQLISDVPQVQEPKPAAVAKVSLVQKAVAPAVPLPTVTAPRASIPQPVAPAPAVPPAAPPQTAVPAPPLPRAVPPAAPPQSAAPASPLPRAVPPVAPTQSAAPAFTVPRPVPPPPAPAPAVPRAPPVPKPS